MTSRRSGAPKPEKLGFSYKANKCTDLGVLTSLEISAVNISMSDTGSTRPVNVATNKKNTK